jgi:hypothetical protein
MLLRHPPAYANSNNGSNSIHNTLLLTLSPRNFTPSCSSINFLRCTLLQLMPYRQQARGMASSNTEAM